MVIDKKCKKCRRAGEKLFLKGDKCSTPKCTLIKRPFAPGKSQASSRMRKNITEYGLQLKEKQKLRNTYGLREKQFAKYIKKAVDKKGVNPSEELYKNLETRLDNVIFRFGLAPSRAMARQLVSHGHMLINGKKTTIPSHVVKIGDVIRIKDTTKSKPVFANLEQKTKNHTLPSWLKFDYAKGEGVIDGMPKNEAGDMPFNLTLVLEFYSR